MVLGWCSGAKSRGGQWSPLVRELLRPRLRVGALEKPAFIA